MKIDRETERQRDGEIRRTSVARVRSSLPLSVSPSLRLVSIAALAAGLLVGGCVRRTLTVNTDPQGSTVILNDQRVGTSPVSVDFTWHGDYDVILEHEGYETLKTHKRIYAPWYQLPGIDLLAEAVVPFTIHEREEMFFELEPKKPVNRDELIDEARQTRERTLYESETGR